MWKGYLVYYYIKLIKLVKIVIKNSNNLTLCVIKRSQFYPHKIFGYHV